MQTAIPAGTSFWVRRLFPVTAALLLSFVFVPSSFAQADPPLNFGNNYFVTGDYVVAGAQGLNASMDSDGLGTGIISFPDGNPGIRGTTTVPKGANIVAALLYWQTVEKVGVPGSGQKGFFGPVRTVKGKPQPQLYPISGLSLPIHTATSFSNGGCSGTSTGKQVQTYRTDVRGYLPLDANGNVLVDTADGVKFEVRLPNVGNNTPLTLGATLVIIYRVINSPNFPLNVITILDGAFAPNATPNFTMSQPVLGFYDAATTPSLILPNPVSRLTHIVGAGKSNKFQTAFLSGGQNGTQRNAVPLPSPYGNGQPAFPGWYGNWDNTTWVFPDPTFPNRANPYPANPLQEDDDSANATVVASGGNPGCVSWSAVIFSTTVNDPEKDGILKTWKDNHGYTDVATGQHVDLTGAAHVDLNGARQQDVFIQLDHVVDSNNVNSNNGDFTPDTQAVTDVTNAFLAHGVHLHISGGNAIPEPACTDNPNASPPLVCPYPNQTGITTWRDGFELIKNHPLNYANEADCEANSPSPPAPPPATPCVRRFPPAQRNSHHYVIFGDTLGTPNWGLVGGGLTDSTGKVPGVVVQSGTTVTFYTSRGHGLVMGDSVNGSGRVTIANASTNPSLNGTYIVQTVHCPVNPDTNPSTGLGDCSTGNRALGPYSFTITIGNSRTANYTLQTDPYIAVASGQARAGSGFSDVGGPGTLVTLGQWGALATLHAKEGTLLHELGHTLGRLHGGDDNTNCKSNYQSVMNYMFQAPLLGPSAKLDLSSQKLNTLDETNLGPITTTDGSIIAIPFTKWYDTKPTLAFKTAIITSFAINSGVVTFQGVNTFTAGTTVQIAGLSNGTYLNGPVLTVISTGLSGTQFEANFSHANAASADSGLAKTTTAVPTGAAADHHCDGTSLTTNDPVTYKFAGGTTLNSLSELDIPWSSTSLDANFEGNPGNVPYPPGNEPHPFNGYDDWTNADYRQVGAGGNEFFSVPGGFVPGGPGGFVPGGPGGFVPGGPGGFVPGGPGGFVPGGPGGFVPGGPGGFVPGGPGAPVEIDSATAVSTIDPPTNLTASEEPSPRIIDLSWDTITFPPINKYNVYRSADQGGTFSLLKSFASPPAQDTTATCKPAGYQYFVTAVFTNTAPITSFSITSNVVTFQAANSFTAGTTVQIAGLSIGTYLNGQVLTVIGTGLSGAQFEASFTHTNVNSTADSGTAVSTKESTGSNIVSKGQNNDLLTGCYNAPAFLSPSPGSSPLQGTSVPITWTVTDFSNINGTFANNPGSNTLVAIGPISDDVTCTTAVGPRTTISSAGAGITFNSNTHQFSFTWNTAGFAQGCYLLELDLDSGQPASGNPGNLPVSAFQVQIYLSDLNESVKVTTTSLPNASEGVAYSQTLQENGGVAPVSWTGTLPPGLTLSSSGTISGTPTTPGFYTFTVTATDSIGDFGTQTLTLIVNAVVTNTADSGPGSLRQAITDVNTGPSGSQPVGILFNIPGGGPVQTIVPGSALPALAKPTNLDATTQPGYAPPTPIIELNGSLAGPSVTGIHITAGGSTVRALDIHSFSGDGILIDTNGGDQILGNYVGTDPTGTTAMPNGGNGIQIIAVANNTVGGTTDAARNIISGNSGEGVRIDGTLATGNIIQGNYIGTNASGSAAVGNSASGVYIRKAPGNSVIGNVVSGNTGFAGITICGNSTFCGGGGPATDETSNASGNIIQGNLVGTNSAGTAALSNNGAGVSIDGAPNTLVGGTAAGTPNTISFNGTNDVQIFSTGANLNKIQGNTIKGTGTNDVGISVGIPAANGAVTGNTLSGNLISGHAGLGIDLAPPNINANVPGGANNYPVISSAQVANGTIMGTLNGPATATFTIEFFSSPGCNTSGNGEGAVFLGFTSVTTDAGGNVVFAAPVAGLVAGNAITATSTDASGTTSEFSACFTATAN